MRRALRGGDTRNTKSSSKVIAIGVDWLVNFHALRVCMDVVERAELGIWLRGGCELLEDELRGGREG
jgi:hypothetical protein